MLTTILITAAVVLTLAAGYAAVECWLHYENEDWHQRNGEALRRR